ncbi:MAG TPA: hypothetical protein VND45_05830 [Thermoanaerobaculia bacterium]|jgi:hypothetical protein|nr:hypothetical protein [Thermoanaerobaculia bacterium]
MLATEEPTAPSHDPAPRPTLLEQWPGNERMRHVPSQQWIVQKLDHDVRRRVEKLLVPFSDIGAADPRHAAIEHELRALSRSLDRVADVARRGRGGHPPNDLAARVRWSLQQAVQNLTAADADTFGRRFPFHTFERSNSEPLWGAMLSVLQHVQNLVPLIREIEPDIDERMYEGLVNLVEPLRREPRV